MTHRRTCLAIAALLVCTVGLLPGEDRILFVLSGHGMAGFYECGTDLGSNNDCKDEQAASISNLQTFNGNHGWGELAGLLTDAGYTLEEIQEGPWDDQAPIDFASMDLSVYDVIVLGSNNNLDYTTADIDAIDSFVQNGGGLLVISDANFGWNWGAAPSSDQLFLDRFGLIVHQDRDTYTLKRANGDYTTAGESHAILDGVAEFDGEGVSPFRLADTTPAGVTITPLAQAEKKIRLNNSIDQGSTVTPGPDDYSLIAIEKGQGRVVAHFDRNTFFNQNGAGTSLHRFDNTTFALNLFAWLSEDLGDPNDNTPPAAPNNVQATPTP